MKKPVFFLSMILLSTRLFAADPPKQGDEARLKTLSEGIRQQLLTLNVNQQEKYLIDFHFSTFHGMYAYRELLEWVAGLPEDHPQRKDLLALVRTGLEAVVRDSGMGLPLRGWQGEGQPVGLCFTRGLPRYATLPDLGKPESLKWDPSAVEKQATPESIGQSLAAKSLFVLTDHTAEGKRLSSLLLQSALAEFATLQDELLPVRPAGKAGRGEYLPAVQQREENRWKTLNGNSYLFAQASLLQGLTQLHRALSAPEAAEMAGGGQIAGKRLADWQKEVRRALETTYHGMLEHHFDPRNGSFIGEYDRQRGRGDRIAAEDAGLAVVVLAELAQGLPVGDGLAQSARKHALDQATYLLRHIGKDGIAPSVLLVEKNDVKRGTLLILGEQIQVINGLLAAERISGDSAYRSAALTVFDSLRRMLWSEQVGIFRTAAGQAVSGYDGHLFGANLALWRRLEKMPEFPDARSKGDTLIRVIVKEGGLQQAEGPATGEPPQPEAFLANDLQSFVTGVIGLKPEEQNEEIRKMVKRVSDQDGDGIPGSRFGGGRFGAAPVLITQTSVKTPFETPQPGAAAPEPRKGDAR